MKFRRLFSLGSALLLLLAVFVIDLIRKNVDPEVGGLSIVRDLMLVGAFIQIALVLRAVLAHRAPNPIRKLGLALIATASMLLTTMLLRMAPGAGFDAKNFALLPLDYATQFAASLLGFTFSVFGVIVILLLAELVLFKRKRSTLRNYRIFLVLLALTALSTLTLLPLESSVVTGILFGLAVAFAIINSFRLSWIVYLTKREKVFSLLYGFCLFGCFTVINIIIGQSGPTQEALLYYSLPMKQVVSLACIFGNVYFGMTFVSTLFHLPTAEAFERKTTEISSLHNLSRLVTQVFDFQELVETVSTMTLQVCEARSCWLELLHPFAGTAPAGSSAAVAAAGYHVEVVGMKNITTEEIDDLLSNRRHALREEVFAGRKPLVVDDVRRDPRFAHLKRGSTRVASMIVVPLISHTGPLGILYVTKENEYGFFKDDVDVVSAFADQATVAIENSRLIKKSIERERLLREMMLAQEMQRKLLPQSLPDLAVLDLAALSTPAFEVGGDYYDVLRIDDHRLGIVVGDVSGKGVSAAFYMSEVKGIFQSLGKLYPSPREFMIKANEALADSIDKHSFISLIYVVVDLTSGTLTLSRAGHCPLLLVSGGTGRYVRPPGMGLGLSRGATFAGSIEEQTIALREGDLCVLYTDGVTEARRGDDEFGYDRLLETAVRAHAGSAAGVKEEILDNVKRHAEQEAHDDDLTIVVLKWRGGNGVRHIVSSLAETVR
jgi:phosphoserine phosphatase RsbU/P